MANLALRSPQYKSVSNSSPGIKSIKCLITINGTLAYTIIKNIGVGTSVTFDIAELSRDYLNIYYSATTLVQSVTILTTLESWSLQNGLGTLVATTSSTDEGFEAYGTFTDEANPELPFTGRALPTFLMAADIKANIDYFEIFVPEGEGGFVTYMDAAGAALVLSYTAGDTVINQAPSLVCQITRINCTKYGIGRKIYFINKFGVQQELWFFLKEAKTVSRRNEKYQSNTLTYPSWSPPEYSTEKASIQLFNTQAKQSYSLSSGYYPEFAVEYFEQLLLSEYVWMKTPRNESSTGLQVIPVVIKSSNILIKTSVNDRLIEYTIEFEDAFDYINNIR